MVEPNQTVSEMTLDELKAMLCVCYSLYLGVNLEEEEFAERLETLCNECFMYHGKLYVWKLRELFNFYANEALEGMENELPTVHSLFIYKMKTAYFKNPSKVRQKMLEISRTRYSG